MSEEPESVWCIAPTVLMEANNKSLGFKIGLIYVNFGLSFHIFVREGLFLVSFQQEAHSDKFSVQKHHDPICLCFGNQAWQRWCMPKSIPAWCPAPGCQVRHHDRELHRALCAPVNTGDREERQEGGQDSHITGNVDGGMGKAVLAVSITVSWPPGG